MTWTYFTAYLDGTRPIAKTERDELYTQLSVQLAACSATLSLNATDQTAITGSGLLTDRASLDNSAGSNTRDRLHAILEAGSGAWSNYASIVAAALTAEGLTSTTRGDILTAGLDTYKLWNYYRRVIDGITCYVPTPTLVCRTASASKTKCGFGSWNTSNCAAQDGDNRKWLLRKFSADSGCTSGTCTLTVRCVAAGGLFFTQQSYDRGTCVETDTGPTHTVQGTLTLSSEYTTALLESDVDAAIPSFSGSYGSSGCSAFYDLTTDEITATKRALQYKFTLPSGLTGCYKLTWVERFTPEGGGSPTDTAKSYLWDGTATETGAYTITPPSAQGTTTIADVVATFDCV